MTGRLLDERLALRAPWLPRQLLKHAMALPPGSPVRRRALKRAMVIGLEAIARRDDEVVLLGLDLDFEINIVSDDLRAVGFAERYSGHEGWRECQRLWRAEWASLRYTPELLIDLGDRQVMRFELVLRGGSSGAEVVQTSGIVTYIVDGLLLRQDWYWHWHECVAALALDGV